LRQCYCKSGKTYDECCAPLLNGLQKADSALALMRSRYTAYALCNIDYIDNTFTGNLTEQEKKEITQWSQNSTWQHLEIVNFTDYTVEFKAYYIYNNKQMLHHELSTFVKQNDTWFYDKGEIFSTKPNIFKNAKCICGSGRKYKVCCMKML